MNLKEFLRPTWKKILLTLIILLSTLFYIVPCPSEKFEILDCIEECDGFPLSLSHFWICGVTNTGRDIYYHSFLINSIFWYLISCFMIFGYNKWKIKGK